MGGHVARIGRSEIYTIFWSENLKLKSPFGRPRRRWEDKVRMDLRDVV
jgi:hypothetical protein